MLDVFPVPDDVVLPVQLRHHVEGIRRELYLGGGGDLARLPTAARLGLHLGDHGGLQAAWTCQGAG